MSRRGAIALTPDEQATFLSQPHKAALATLDADGYPHLVAMSFLWRDGAIWMTSYAKAQKVVNARRDPRVGVMIEAGGQYAEFKAVMVRGRAEVIEDPALVQDVMRSIAAKRTSRTPEGAASSAPKRVVIKVVPDKTVTWDHTKLGGRY